MTDEKDERSTPTGDVLRKQMPGNSHKQQEQKRERPKPVVSSEVKKAKTPLGRKFKEAFVGDDAQTVGGYILFDVIIPATKNLITDMVTQGLERALFGDARGRLSGGANRYSGSSTSYRRSYTGSSGISRSDEPRVTSHRPRDPESSDDIFVVSTRGEAEEVVQRMGDLIDSYTTVSVADMKDLLNVSSDFTDNKWGWTDLRGTDIRRVRNGFLLDLPRAKPLD